MFLRYALALIFLCHAGQVFASDWLLNSYVVAASCTITESPETTCTGGIDEDCDGLIDGADSDCVSSGFVGYNDSTPDSNNYITTANNQSGYIPSTQATQSGPVGYIHISMATDISAQNWNCGIYSADGSTLLRDGALGNPTSNGGGFYTIQLDSTYDVDSATSYRLACGTSNGGATYANRISVGGAAASYREMSGVVGDTMPSPMTGGVAVNYNRFIIYADNNAGIQ